MLSFLDVFGGTSSCVIIRQSQEMTLASDFYSFSIRCLGDEWGTLKHCLTNNHMKTCQEHLENMKIFALRR
jgi:hypothetical protein